MNLPLISKRVHLCRSLALNPMISLATEALLVLCSQRESRKDAASEQEYYEVAENDSMPRSVPRSVSLPVNITRDDTVQIAPASRDH
jgi:hypothetical protein